CHHPFGRPGGGFNYGGRPGRRLNRRAGKGVLQRAIALGIGDDRQARAQAPRLRGQGFDRVAGHQCFDAIAVGVTADQVDSALPDRPGRPQDRYVSRPLLGRRPPSVHVHGHDPPIANRTKATTISTATSPSMRSSSPPWPGINVPLSFTPALLLAADSARSPIWSTTARPAPTAARWIVSPSPNA